MDPVANLKEQRALAAHIIVLADREDGDPNGELAECASRLAELVQALDEWRTRGGFDPYTV
jgi:hypothetical protein